MLTNKLTKAMSSGHEDSHQHDARGRFASSGSSSKNSGRVFKDRRQAFKYLVSSGFIHSGKTKSWNHPEKGSAKIHMSGGKIHINHN